MAMLTKQAREVLSLVRGYIRDLDKGWSPSEACSDAPQRLTQKLSEILNEEYDYETGEVTSQPAVIAPVYRIHRVQLEHHLEATMNALAADGYHVKEVFQTSNMDWMVIAFNPALLGQQTGQQLADAITKGLDLSAFKGFGKL